MDKVNNHTPLKTDSIKKNLMSIESAENIGMPSMFNRYNIILAISILAFVAGFSFWIFVTFMI